MNNSTTFLSANDEHRIALHTWLIDDMAKVKGVVHWLHGMAEHGARYARLGEVLNQIGWNLVCHDHRGHGNSTDTDAPAGHFADKRGWVKVQSDVATVQNWIKNTFVGIPVVLAGHSMGSLIARYYAESIQENYLPTIKGLIMCGSDYHTPFYYRLMRLPLQLEALRLGKRSVSPLTKALTFSAWNKQFKPNRTAFDWLSSVNASVDDYINDPLCGQDTSITLWLDLVTALTSMDSPARIAALPKNLPVLLIGGNQDPMSQNGKGMRALAKALNRYSQTEVAAIQFEGRHEILNDACAPQVLQTIGQWLADIPD